MKEIPFIGMFQWELAVTNENNERVAVSVETFFDQIWTFYCNICGGSDVLGFLWLIWPARQAVGLSCLRAAINLYGACENSGALKKVKKQGQRLIAHGAVSPVICNIAGSRVQSSACCNMNSLRWGLALDVRMENMTEPLLCRQGLDELRASYSCLIIMKKRKFGPLGFYITLAVHDLSGIRYTLTYRLLHAFRDIPWAEPAISRLHRVRPPAKA